MKMIGKRTLSLLLCLVMILSLAGTAAFAEGNTITLSDDTPANSLIFSTSEDFSTDKISPEQTVENKHDVYVLVADNYTLSKNSADKYNISVKGTIIASSVDINYVNNKGELPYFVFEMPEEPVTVSASFETYGITINDYSNGTVTLKKGGTDITTAPTGLYSGDTITVTAAPSTGYRVASGTISYTQAGQEKTENLGFSENSATFTMPAANVTVSVAFEEIKYPVFVKGIQVTENNKTNVLGDISSASVSYDPGNKTITLHGDIAYNSTSTDTALIALIAIKDTANNDGTYPTYMITTDKTDPVTLSYSAENSAADSVAPIYSIYAENASVILKDAHLSLTLSNKCKGTADALTDCDSSAITVTANSTSATSPTLTISGTTELEAAVTKAEGSSIATISAPTYGDGRTSGVTYSPVVSAGNNAESATPVSSTPDYSSPKYIKIVEAAPTTPASPTPTTSAEATVSPTPTASAEATVSPTPTASAEATVSPTPTASAEATVSPTPTATAEATVAPTPTATAEATATLTSTTTPSPSPDIATILSSRQISIGGTAVTVSNYENIDGANKISYDPTTNTLTLNGDLSAVSGQASISYLGEGALTIKTTGTTAIKIGYTPVQASNASFLRFFENEANADDPTITYGVYAPNADVIFNGLYTIEPSADTNGVVGVKAKTVTVQDGSNVTIHATNTSTSSGTTAVGTECNSLSVAETAVFSSTGSAQSAGTGTGIVLSADPKMLSISCDNSHSATFAGSNSGIDGVKSVAYPTGYTASVTLDGTPSTADASTVYTSAKTVVICQAPNTTPATGISLNYSTYKLEKGATFTLTPTVTPTDASDKTVTWTSSNEAYATVDEKGVVTGVAAGTATITAKAHGAATGNTVETTCVVTIVAVQTVTPSTTDLTVYAGSSDNSYPKTSQLTATVTMSDSSAYSGTVEWTSLDPSIATVTADSTDSKKATVTAVAAGTTSITAKAGGVSSAACTVKVVTYVPVQSITVSPTNQTITTRGGTKTMAVSYNPTNATNRSVLWTSSAPSVATVNEKTGVVTAVGNGVTQITAKWVGNSTIADTTQLTVNSASYGTQYTLYQNSRAWYYNAGTLTDYYCYSTYPYADTGLKVYVDNVLVASGNYYYGSTNESSYPTYLRFYTSYMKTLGYGRHYLYLQYSDGSYAQAYFYVRSIYDAPLTGDSSNLALWSVLAAITCAGAASAVILIRRKKKPNT